MSSTSTYLYCITVQAAVLLQQHKCVCACVFERNRNMFHLSSDIKVIKTILKLSERAILFDVIAVSARQPTVLIFCFCLFVIFRIILSSFLFTFRSTELFSVSSSVVFMAIWHKVSTFRPVLPEEIPTSFLRRIHTNAVQCAVTRIHVSSRCCLDAIWHLNSCLVLFYCYPTSPHTHTSRLHTVSIAMLLRRWPRSLVITTLHYQVSISGESLAAGNAALCNK